MSATARRLLASLLIALHASISALGPGLHAGAGGEHDGPGRVAKHLHGQGGLVQAAPDAPEHCPICEHLAQGQWSPPAVAPAPCSRVAALGPVASRPIDPRPPILAARPRAPPRGDVRPS